MKQRIDIGTRMAGDKARLPDEFITASQSATRYLLVVEFNGQTLFKLPSSAQREFLPMTERLAAYLVVNGVSYWQPTSFTIVESGGDLYINWAAPISLSVFDELYLVRQ